MSNEIVTYAEMPLDERKTYAYTVAQAASMLPNGIRAGGPEQVAANAFLIMETGSMLDLHPIAALSSVNIIEGKPSLGADLMVTVARKSGHTVRVTEEGSVEGGDYKATVELIRKDDPEHPVTSVWTPQRAARAGLCKYELDAATGQWRVIALSRNDTPLPWQLYTEALCKARAKSECIRDGASDSLNGARYTPEELGAQVDAVGNPIITSLGEAEMAKPAESETPTALPPRTRRATNGTQGTRRGKRVKAEPVAEEAPEMPAAPPVAPEADVVDAEVAEEQKAPETPAQAPEPVAEVDPERAEREREAEEQTRIASEREARIATADAVDRDDEAAVAAWNAEHGKATGRYLTSTAEMQRQAEKVAAPTEAPAPAEAPEPEYLDRKTGTVYDTQAELDAAIRARVQANIATDAGQVVATVAATGPSFDDVVAAKPTDYRAQLAVATTIENVKAIWAAAQADTENPMSNDLKMDILAVKGKIEAAGQ